MTRKDYIAIAAALRDTRLRTLAGDVPNFAGCSAVEAAALAIAQVMAKDNENFDHKRFMETCGF